ncbi:DNA cytosine methyltransferase [Streptomyces sp. NPDC102406]|uniref:DNA cytosine methyltransferase n=1 Tax=Streptomyces sp. NPDC102406 TaxID=3366171 RepID=UPI0038059430
MRFVDVCSGGGGLALGLEQAGFTPALLVDNSKDACNTLRENRPEWKILEEDLIDFVPDEHKESYDVDLLSAGLPRVSAATAAKKGELYEEVKLLEATALLVHPIRPKALLVENSPDLVESPRFESVRAVFHEELDHLGYRYEWFVLNAADFGVPQDRKQGVLVALRKDYFDSFLPPAPTVTSHTSLGEALLPSMSSKGWQGAEDWAAQATSPAPTLIGGSKKHGGADLGQTGSKRAWARMGICGLSLGNDVPEPNFDWRPNGDGQAKLRITVDQAAILQSFPQEWTITGKKTARFRQIAPACPPPVGRALGTAIAAALKS